MRIWIVIIVSIVIGLALGLGTTIIELGISPNGASRIEFGPKLIGPTPLKQSTDGPPPKAVVEGEQSEYNFGRAEKDVPQRRDFVIRNVGKGPLKLLLWKTSCSCITAVVEHAEVPPCGSTKVTLDWTPKVNGPFRQSAQIFTNDEQKMIELVVAGEIASSFRVEADRIVFTNILPGKPSTATARIFSYGTTTLDVLRHEFSNASITGNFDLAVEKMSAEELKQEAGAKSGCILRVTVKPGLPAGPFAQRIHLHLNLPKEPEVVLQVEGKVASPIEVVSRRSDWNSERGVLTLGQIRSNEGAKAELVLMVREGAQDKVDVKLATPAPVPLEVTIGKMEKLTASTSQISLTVAIPPGAHPVDRSGNEQGRLARIILETGLPDVKQLQILVGFTIVE